MSRQLETSPAVCRTDSIPEYASTQLATPTVTTAIACGSPFRPTSRTTSAPAPQDDVRARRVDVDDAERDQVQEDDRGRDEDAERDARVLADPDDVQPRDAPDDRDHEDALRPGPIGTNAVPLMTALTVEMHAVRM
jgi:hypothetical protein